MVSLAWHTLRLDLGISARDDYIECILVVHEIQLPLLDLFRPPETLSEQGYYDEFWSAGLFKAFR